MSAKIVSSLTDDNRLGCMNGIFQLFDHHRFIVHRRISSHNHKRQLQGVRHQLERHEATKAVIEKDLEVQKENPRLSTESSRASFSSSSYLSAFSSLDNNRTSQAETPSLRQINTSENPFQNIAKKEQQPRWISGLQPPDIQDVVRNSMHREARGVSIKSLANDERKVTVIKRNNSPRPLQQFKFENAKATVYKEAAPVFTKVQEGTKNSKNGTPALPRFSFDGRESQGTFRDTMKLKELPRLSLDGKASPVKDSALQSRLNFLAQELPMENDNSRQVLPSKQEPGSRTPPSSIVTKLMGLDSFPDSISEDERWITKIESSPWPRVTSPSKSSKTAAERKQSQVSSSSPFAQKKPTLLSPPSQKANSLRKPITCSRHPMKPAPWKQRDSIQGSSKIAAQSRKTPSSTPRLSSSVGGEIEKRITELEFKRSGKDLKALKQVLEAIHKTREGSEKQREPAERKIQRSCSFEDGCSKQNYNLSICQRRNVCHHGHVPTTTAICSPKHVGSSVPKTKAAKATEKVKNSSSTQVPRADLQRFQYQDPKGQKENPGHRRKATDLLRWGNNMKESRQHPHPIDSNTTLTNLELQRTSRAVKSMRVENCSSSETDFKMVSPRLQQNVLRMKGESHPPKPLSESARVKKHSTVKGREQCSHNRKQKMKSTYFQPSDEQLYELSSETRYLSYQGDTASVKSEEKNCIASRTETEGTKLAEPINANTRAQQTLVSTAKYAVNAMEQPSPISILDPAFFNEGSPFPVKKMSTAFRDERPNLDEAEWHLENLNQLADCKRSDPGSKYGQRSENVLHLIHEAELLKTKPNETAANHNESLHLRLKRNHRYNNKILGQSGLFKDTGIIQIADQVVDPNLFDALEKTEVPVQEPNSELFEKKDWMDKNQKIKRKIILDMVNEILVHRITSGGLFPVGRKRESPQELMKEVYLEMDRLYRMPCCNLDENDGSIRLLTSDTMYQSDDWTTYNGEVPALVLDIECLMFKDLINEVVTGEIMGHHDWLNVLNSLPNSTSVVSPAFLTM